MGYMIIVSSEYGSGGRHAAKRAAELLGISFYGDNVNELIAERSGLDADAVRKWYEMKTSSFLYDAYLFSQMKPVTEHIYSAKAELMREIAAREDCVMTETCADGILRDLSRCLRVFVYAPLTSRVRRAKEEYGVEDGNIEAFIKKKDRRRASYYDFYENGKWGVRENYDLVINSDIGVEQTAQLIAAAAKLKCGSEK